MAAADTLQSQPDNRAPSGGGRAARGEGGQCAARTSWVASHIGDHGQTVQKGGGCCSPNTREAKCEPLYALAVEHVL
eukprot:SAG11_NODE_942_length_6435_cov_27.522096_4_plen_77_part_00